MGHFDSKARIEAHIRTLPIRATVVRPVAFMEMLVMPGFGLNEGRFTFFAHPDQAIQLLAVKDIGKFVAAIFADPARFGGETIEIASDSVTGRDIEARFTEAAGRPAGAPAGRPGRPAPSRRAGGSGNPRRRSPAKGTALPASPGRRGRAPGRSGRRRRSR